MTLQDVALQLFIYFSLKCVVAFKDTLACVAFDPVCVHRLLQYVFHSILKHLQENF